MSSDLIFCKSIPDVIWDHIPITEGEEKIINSASFSRLKEVKQMGVASITFPGALHNRYMHSIGVMHVADMMLSMIRIVHKEEGELVERADNQWLSQYVESYGKNQGSVDLRRVVRVAGLLHDLGHPPLSHLLEELFRKYPGLTDPANEPNEKIKTFLEVIRKSKQKYSHEAATSFLIRTDQEIREGIKNALQISHRPDSDEIVEQVALLIQGQATKAGFRLLNPIIVGDLDADKIDYLLRDSYFCGTRFNFSPEEFRGKLFLDEDDYTTLYIGSEAIAFVTTFLYARYKIIHDIQHAEKNRIATQELVEAVKTALEKEPGQAKEEIMKMHVDSGYVDSSLENLLVSRGLKPKITDIRRGNLDHNQALTLTRSFFDPIIRGFLHSISNHPPAIAELQEEIRTKINIPGLLVDVRDSKPPEFKVNINHDRKTYPPVYNYSETAHAILTDSIRDLTLYVYLPENPPVDLKPHILEILESIREKGKWASNERMKESKPIGKDILLLIFKSLINSSVTNDVFQDIKNQLDLNSDERVNLSHPWVYGQSFFQPFVEQLIHEGNKSKRIILEGLPEGTTQKSRLSSTFFRMLEILRVNGLICSRDEVIGVPPKGGGSDRNYIFRFDYWPTSYGLEYCEQLLGYSACIREYYQIIDEIIKNWQSDFRQDLTNFARSEEKIRLLRPKSTPAAKTEFENVERSRQAIREKLEDREFKACLLVL